MPKNAKQLEKILLKNGWIMKSQKGSHRHYIHPFKKGKISIPFHNSKDLPQFIEKNILKKAGLLKEDKKTC